MNEEDRAAWKELVVPHFRGVNTPELFERASKHFKMFLDTYIAATKIQRWYRKIKNLPRFSSPRSPRSPASTDSDSTESTIIDAMLQFIFDAYGIEPTRSSLSKDENGVFFFDGEVLGKHFEYAIYSVDDAFIKERIKEKMRGIYFLLLLFLFYLIYIFYIYRRD